MLQWPPNNSDLNLIENWSSYLKFHLDKDIVRGFDNLFEVASEIFSETAISYNI